MRISLVGTTRSGKTVYLASLLRAAFTQDRVMRPIKVRPGADCEPALDLFDSATGILCGTMPAGTTTLTRYQFVADLPGSLLAGLGKCSLDITLTDPPGGDCMPPAGSSLHPAVLADLCEADGLLLILPGDAAKLPGDLCDRLDALAQQVAEAKGVEPGKPVFLRACVVVTMAELLPAGNGGSALDELESKEPYDLVVEHVGSDLVRALRGMVAPGGDGYALVSAMGFDRSTRGVAAHREAGDWKLVPGPRGFDEAWWPYRVFEPLEFLARGVAWRARMAP